MVVLVAASFLIYDLVLMSLCVFICMYYVSICIYNNTYKVDYNFLLRYTVTQNVAPFSHTHTYVDRNANKK